jgi:Recombination endonuclease VII
MADKRGRVYDPVTGAEKKRRQMSDPVKRAKAYDSSEKWRAVNRDANLAYQRNAYFIRTFGITAEEKDKMVLESGGICPICLSDFKDRRDTHLDHDHATGQIRGLLCGSCNRKLGWYEKHRGRVDGYLTKRE